MGKVPIIRRGDVVVTESGVPIEGEAGVDYLLRKGSDIPPLMFTTEELEALGGRPALRACLAGERLVRGGCARTSEFPRGPHALCRYGEVFVDAPEHGLDVYSSTQGYRAE